MLIVILDVVEFALRFAYTCRVSPALIGFVLLRVRDKMSKDPTDTLL
jgi:hypothetical protein